LETSDVYDPNNPSMNDVLDNNLDSFMAKCCVLQASSLHHFPQLGDQTCATGTDPTETMDDIDVHHGPCKFTPVP
jgi:hypothetical protein